MHNKNSPCTSGSFALPYAIRAALALLAGIPAVLRGADVGALTIHGAVSATVSSSDRYNYLGDTADSIRVNNVETTLNGNYRFDNGLRLSAQIYNYKIGDYKDVVLDYASASYSFNQNLGVRVGRNKHPFGLYGDSMDVDMLRPFVFLPSGIYPKTGRALMASIDGLTLFGSTELGGAGSLSYQAYVGVLPGFTTEDPFMNTLNESSPISFNSIDKTGDIAGAWLSWETPVDGLRAVASVTALRSLRMSGVARSSSDLALAPSDVRLLPYAFPAGVWDAAAAGMPASINVADYKGYVGSLEYTTGAWQFAVEYQTEDVATITTLPLAGASSSEGRTEAYFVLATWQATDRLQLGAYHSWNYDDVDDRDGSSYVVTPGHRAWQKDFAITGAFALTDWWLLKTEYHFMNGTKILSSQGNGDAATWTPNWSFWSIKTTFSF